MLFRLHGGAVAQLGARLDGIEEAVGSNPIGSTKSLRCNINSRRLGARPPLFEGLNAGPNTCHDSLATAIGTGVFCGFSTP
jgi:hypothetical protein